MHYPLIDRELLAALRSAHGVYNALMLLLFLVQGWFGLKIRRHRSAGAALPYSAIRQHRTAGPILSLMGGLGFFAGLTLVLLDTGNVLEYPIHFIVGLVIVVLLIATFKISLDIHGQNSPFRTPHFVLGLAILCSYFLNVLLGIGVMYR